MTRTPSTSGRSAGRRTRHARRALPLVLGSVAVLAAGCGGSSGAPSASTAAGGSSGSSPVQVKDTSLGKVLTDPTGRTLYLLTSDTATSTTCSGPCLSAWPPLAATSGATSAAGVSGGLGTFSRPEGSRQLTVAGHPLYTYAGDSGPGQTSGEGIRSFGGTWWAVAPDGSAVQRGSGSSGGSGGQSSGGQSSGGSSRSGYGY